MIGDTPTPIAEPVLLLRPQPSRFEGPQGYFLRLAEANCFTPSELKQLGIRYEPGWLSRQRLLPEPALDPALQEHVARMSGLWRNQSRIWNQRHARFCPHCLAEDPTWQAGWEILFYDVCPRHGVWMVDRCSSCRQPLQWNRDSLVRCQCGSDLREETSIHAPENSRRLSAALEARLLAKETADNLVPLAGLDLEQSQRLIRYLGGYMDPASGPKPLKLRNAGLMSASWPVSSLAAEISADWPRAFHACWTRMQESASDEKAGLNVTFRRAYLYLYKGFREGAFLPIRQAFEAWLGEHWKGGLCRRNRRLTARLLATAQWIPGKVAADQLGISVNRLRNLMQEGYVDGQESVSATGRRFLVVRRDQLEQITAQLAGEMTMTAAMEALGIGKVRMRRLLRLLFPAARRLNGKASMPWIVPRGEVESLVAVGTGLPIVSLPEEHQVSLAHVFKYWTWTAEEIVSLVEATKSGVLSPVAMLDSARGISRWVFEAGWLTAWQATLTSGHAPWLTIPDAALALGVKQQVVYWLTLNGYIPTSEKLSTTRRSGARVRREEINVFKERYVFGREIAALIGRSSRRTARLLAERGIYPIRGHSPDPCRQLVYVRDEGVQRFLKEVADGRCVALDLQYRSVNEIGSNHGR